MMMAPRLLRTLSPPSKRDGGAIPLDSNYLSFLVNIKAKLYYPKNFYSMTCFLDAKLIPTSVRGEKMIVGW